MFSKSKILSVNSDNLACGHYRIIWPNQTVNLKSKEIEVSTVNFLPTSLHFYKSFSKVKAQRLSSDSELKTLKKIKQISKLKVIYEADDVMFHEDIPNYNVHKEFYKNVRKNILSMMTNFSDEILTSSKALCEYYISKTNKKNISVIPNYVPKFWIDRFFSKKKMLERYLKFKKRPRILFPASASHFDYLNLNNKSDDFTHLIKFISKTVDDFEWVFLTTYPKHLEEFVKAGKIKSFAYSDIYEYPYLLDRIEPNLIVAPLADNIFNNCKSDIKLKEACSLGIPSIMQDLRPYEKAFFNFRTGDELIDLIKLVMRDELDYLNHCENARLFAAENWLENKENIGKHIKCYNKQDLVPELNNTYEIL